MIDGDYFRITSMVGKNEGGIKVAYTPELSDESSCTLRRLAWAMQMPMTKAIEEVFDYLPKIVDKRKVCEGCRDRTKCRDCAFRPI